VAALEELSVMSGTGSGWRWLFGVVAVVGLLASACGDSDDGSDEGSDVTTTEAIDSGQEDGAVTAGQCAEDAPDCEDTEVVDDDAAPDTSGPQTSDGGGEVDSSTGMTVNGGLSVSEALDSKAAGVTGVIAVRGHLYDEGAGAALCETLTGGGERYICGGPLLPVQGLDLEPMRDDVIIHDGLTYTEVEITVFGEIVDGTLVVDPTVS
jgi:hypothetical protein